jgi:uncharacterized protein YjgD (DUF1641 family)
MAKPILLNLPPRDHRESLYHRLENAPDEHAEALLAAYDILQGLHDKGILEILKGGIHSGEKVLQIGVDAANTPEVIRGIRNLMILTKLLGTLDPKILESVASVVPKAMDDAKKEKPMGLFQIMGKLTNQHSRRMLSIAARVVDTLGKDLGPDKSR